MGNILADRRPQTPNVVGDSAVSTIQLNVSPGISNRNSSGIRFRRVLNPGLRVELLAQESYKLDASAELAIWVKSAIQCLGPAIFRPAGCECRF